MALVVYQGPGSTDDAAKTGSSSSLTPFERTLGSPFVGLSNQGATCYLNGLLQTLFMTPEFRRALYRLRYSTELHGPTTSSIPYQLQCLFGCLQMGNRKAVDTIGLTKSFDWDGGEVYQQQDVQEMTRVLFDQLEKDFKQTPLEDVINLLYAGQQVDYIRCIDVDYETERVDSFLDFSLAIVPFGATQALNSLIDCIETYLTPEILDGENQYKLEVEGRETKKVDAIKGLKFSKLPEILTIHLKR